MIFRSSPTVDQNFLSFMGIFGKFGKIVGCPPSSEDPGSALVTATQNSVKIVFLVLIV